MRRPSFLALTAFLALVVAGCTAQTPDSENTPATQPAAPAPTTKPQVNPHLARYEQVLATYVDAKTGDVAYTRLAANAEHMKWVDDFARSPLPSHPAWGKPTTEQQLAGQINRYNARVLYEVAKNFTAFKNKPNGVLSQDDFFKKPLPLEGRQISLNDYEGETRKLGVPSLHFGVNCGSIGCPRLLATAFKPATVKAELAELERDAIRATTRVKGNTVELIELFNWYGKDFSGFDPGTQAAQHLAKVRDYVKSRLGNDPKSVQIRQALDRGAKITYRQDWNWAVNGK